jgi:hypothetical protein
MAITARAQHAALLLRITVDQEKSGQLNAKGEIPMRKFGLVFTALILAVGFGAFNASTTQQVAAPSDRIDALEPMKMMVGSANLPSEHFVDYSLIFP